MNMARSALPGLDKTCAKRENKVASMVEAPDVSVLKHQVILRSAKRQRSGNGASRPRPLYVGSVCDIQENEP